MSRSLWLEFHPQGTSRNSGRLDGHSLYSPHTRSYSTFAHNLEQAYVSRSPRMGASAQLFAEITMVTMRTVSRIFHRTELSRPFQSFFDRENIRFHLDILLDLFIDQVSTRANSSGVIAEKWVKSKRSR